jgi:paraquat-inducible protein B
MSQKVNPTLIGLFIVVGVTLGVAGLLLFNTSKLFVQSRDCILYFDNSLNGLSEGAPVKYRGVPIGSVKKLMIRFNQKTNDYAMPVLVEIQKKLIEDRMGEQSEVFTDVSLERRIKHGLRASLATESLVTGQLYIEMHPNPYAPRPEYHQIAALYPEIPTEPTQIQQLMENLASLDIKSLETNANQLLTHLETAISALQFAQINAGLTNLLVSADRLVNSAEITNALLSLSTTLDEYKLLGQKLNTRVDPLVDSLTNTLADANRALSQFRGAAENIRTLVAPDSPLRNGLDETLQELSSAVQSLSSLVDFLKQHPNALITGRQTREK